MIRSLAIVATVVGLLVIGVRSTSAQTPERATGLAGAIGVADDSAATGVVAGGSVLVDLLPNLAVEGAARWLDRGEQASAFAADLSALVGMHLSERVMPYVTGGVGVYRASFEVPIGSGPPPDVPGFYARRFSSTPVGSGKRRLSFTDPTISLGAGVSFSPRRSMVLRPDVRVLFVRDEGESHTVLLGTMNIGFRFEHRPVTP